MSARSADVLLITNDAELIHVVGRQRPAGARLACVSHADATHVTLPDARQWWIDLDGAATLPPGARARKRIYFYNRIPRSTATLPNGLFIRKPCADAVIAVLWAGVPLEHAAARRSVATPAPGSLPISLVEYLGLPLRELAARIARQLPLDLGARCAALYLRDADARLTLLDSSFPQLIDTSLALEPANSNSLAQVALDGNPWTYSDVHSAAAARGWLAPAGVAGAGAMVPLRGVDGILGLVLIESSTPPAPEAVANGPQTLFDALARSLSIAIAHDAARREAEIDGLTGLRNYRWMQDALHREVQRAQRYQTPLSLLAIDLDGLKRLNDQHGHAAGDELLRQVAARIRAGLRQIDAAARVGGDEFLALLPAADHSGAENVANRIQRAIRAGFGAADGTPWNVTASIGIATWIDGWSAAELARAADRALYAAKRAGGDRMNSDAPATIAREPAPPTNEPIALP